MPTPCARGWPGSSEPLDGYGEVFDPYDADEVEQRLLSDDLTDAAVDLLVGLGHYEAGRSTRGAVVVAVHLPELLGHRPVGGAARAAEPDRPRPPRRRP